MIGLETALIAQLLMDHAPSESLDNIGLNRGNQSDWITLWDEERRTQRGAFHIVEISALALYYATRKRWKWRENSEYGRFEIDPFTLCRFAEMVKVDETDATTTILETIRRDAGRQRIKKAQENPPLSPHDWLTIDTQVAKWRADGVNEREMSNKVKQRFKVPESTYRSRRKKIGTQ